MRMLVSFLVVLLALGAALLWNVRDGWSTPKIPARTPTPLTSTPPALESQPPRPPAAPPPAAASEPAPLAPEHALPAPRDSTQRIEERTPVRWAGRVTIAAALQQYRAAKLAFEAEPFDADRFEAALALAKSNGWWTEVRGLLARRLAAAPDDVRLHNQLGAVMLRLRSPIEAAVALKRAVELDPGAADAWYNLAIAEQSAGHLAAARGAWDEVIRRMPANPDALAHRAEIALDLRDWAAAERDLREALRLEPDQLDATLNLARALHAQERLAEARTLLEALLPGAPENVLLLNRLAQIAADQAFERTPDRAAHLHAARDYCRRSLARAANQPELTELLQRISENPGE